MDVLGTPFITMYAIWDAGVTAGQVVLEGSPDNINWLNLGTLNFSAGVTNSVSINNQAHRYVRTRISTPPTGGNVHVWLTSTGFKEFSNDAGWSDPLNIGLTGSYRGAGIGFPTGSAFVSQEKLLLSYNMETLNSSLMDDLSNNHFDGTITGTSDILGNFGRARSFNGTSDFISHINDPLFSPNAISVSTWIFVTIAPSGFKVIGGHWNDITVNRRSWFLSWSDVGQNSPRFYISVDGTSFTNAISSVTITPNTWHHLCGTYDGVNLKIYIDGVLTGTAQTTGGLFINTVDPILVGAGDAGTTTRQFFGGTLDEFQVYGRCLNASEVLALANRA